MKVRRSGEWRVIGVQVILLVLAFLLSACTGNDGKTYQKYWWSGSLGYLYDSNPSTPATVYNDVYFRTKEGDFYLQYQAFDGSEWYAYYSIEADEGTAPMHDGDDLWFEICLYSTGPTLYRWDFARSLEVQSGDREESQRSPEVAESSLSEDESSVTSRNGPVLGSEVFVGTAGKVKLRFGKMLPKD